MRKNVIRIVIELLFVTLLCLPALSENNVEIGQTVTFGHYPQTADGTDNSPVEWIVLDVQDDKALIISKYGLDAYPIDWLDEFVTWETCRLRSWLNFDFKESAFTTYEQSLIITTNVDNSESQGNPDWHPQYVNSTHDELFLLSYAEVQKYLGVVYDIWNGWKNNNDLLTRIAPTEYAIKNGVYTDSNNLTDDGKPTSPWWLRSHGIYINKFAAIDCKGAIISDDYRDTRIAVRPALWVKIDKSYSDGSISRNNPKGASAELDDIRIGDYVTFGHYPQTINGTDDKPIEWLVLNTGTDSALLISRYGLDVAAYNEQNEECTWETSSLRKWLNNDFLNRAFDEHEQSGILFTVVKNDKAQGYPQYVTIGGNNTGDNVFLLSYAEAQKYLEVRYTHNRDTSRASAALTEFALNNGAIWNGKYTPEDEYATCWWLRSPGGTQSDAIMVNEKGLINYYNATKKDGTVRPSLWVKLDFLVEAKTKYNDEIVSDSNVQSEKNENEQDGMIHVGDYLSFGHYPQNAESDEMSSIDWLVLDVADRKALVISRQALDARQYNEDDVEIEWADCTLREWLNYDFLEAAFTEAEQDCILITDIDNSIDQSFEGFEMEGGQNTRDQIFLLSYAEAHKYFDVRNDRKLNLKSRVAPTAHAISNGAKLSDNDLTIDKKKSVSWWLRSRSDKDHFVACIYGDGILHIRHVMDRIAAIRPAMWIDLEQLATITTDESTTRLVDDAMMPSVVGQDEEQIYIDEMSMINDESIQSKLVESTSNEDYEYEITADGTIRLVEYHGELGDTFHIQIPETVEGKPVTSIGEHLFDKYPLYSVFIPNSIDTIEGNPFFNAIYIEVTSDNQHYEFENCMLIEKNEKKLICCASAHDDLIIEIPQGICAIGDDAFRRRSLTDVSIPDSVTSIGVNPFRECFKLERITVDSNNPIYANMDGYLVNMNNKTLISCPLGLQKKGLKSVPKDIRNIGDNAFYEANKVESITLPLGIRGIGNHAFAYCSALRSFTVPDGVKTIGDYAFEECPKLWNISIPNSVSSIGINAFPHLTNFDVNRHSYAYQFLLNNGYIFEDEY